MNRIVFLLEEPSMRDFLEALLPRLFPGMLFQCLAHEGKNDLEKSIPRKLRASWPPGVRFVILRDNDGADCVQLKRRLLHSCQTAGRGDTLVRIVCQELEAWYLGEPVENALTDIRNMRLEGQALLRRLEALRFRYRLNPPENPDMSQLSEPQVVRIVCSDGLV